ncbi:beta strand repeat-containing protein, partial [Flavobacterium sp.]|uniref:beta strand repeat-containing protein n=1 Tax=Flavobacterium sp. TaxID=239 RepID=UPI003B9AF1A4
MILKKYAPIFFTLFFSSVFGQNIVWNFGTAAPSTNTTSNLTVGNVTQGNVNGAVTMLSNTSVSSVYAGASGGNNAGIAVQNGALNTATSSYFEFVLTPAAGFTVSLNAISFGMRSTGTGPVNFVVRSSSDSYASNLASGTDSANSAWTLKSPTTTTTVTSGNGTAITFRIYGFGGTGAVANTAQWRIDDLQLTVTVNQVFALNGNIDEAVWGTALATSAGGPTPSFGASHAINAVYSYGDASYLYFAIAGNVQSGNRILLFIDSAAGGFNNGSFNRTNAPSGVNNWNSSTTFDAGFNADYCAVIGTNGSGTYFLDLFTLTSGTGSNTFIGSAGSEFGINVDNTSLTRGFEFRIPKTALNYTANQELQLFAAYTSDGGFLSNQFLTRANSGDGSYGSGAVTFGSAAPNPITVPYVSRQTGNWADATTWRLGTGNPTNVGISILNGHNVTVAAAAGNINALNVNTGGTLTIGGTNTLSFNNTQTFTNAGTTTFSGSGFITMGTNSTLANSGTLTMGSGSLTFGNAGVLNQTGTFTAGTSTVTFNGQGTISGTVVANNITANGQLTLSNAVTVNGTLRLNLNSFVDGANSPTYGSASTLLYNHGGAFAINRGNEWTSATSGAGFPNNVTLSNNTTFNMNLGTSASMGGNLTVDSGSIFNSLAGTLNIAGSVLNNGTLNTGAGGIVSTGTVTNNGSLVLNGDFTTSA